MNSIPILETYQLYNRAKDIISKYSDMTDFVYEYKIPSVVGDEYFSLMLYFYKDSLSVQEGKNPYYRVANRLDKEEMVERPIACFNHHKARVVIDDSNVLKRVVESIVEDYNKYTIYKLGEFYEQANNVELKGSWDMLTEVYEEPEKEDINEKEIEVFMGRVTTM